MSLSDLFNIEDLMGNLKLASGTIGAKINSKLEKVLSINLGYCEMKRICYILWENVEINNMNLADIAIVDTPPVSHLT